MDLTPSQEQQDLIAWATDLVADKLPLDRLVSEPIASDMAAVGDLAELGWIGVGLPEECGGLGLSAIEETLLLDVAGCALAGPDLLANILAAHLAHDRSDSALTQAFVSGARRATIVFPDNGIRIMPDNGAFALGAEEGNDLVVLDGDTLVLAPPSQSNREPSAFRLDESIALRHVALAADWRRDAAPHSRSWLRAQLFVAALLVGAGRGALDMAVGYAKLREQFGKPIGAFQAIKHKCADVALQLASARSQASFAAASLAENRADAAFQIAAARALAGTAAVTAAYANIQIHGGIGFTSECHAQRFAKRVTLLNLLGGGPKCHRDALISGPPPLSEAA